MNFLQPISIFLESLLDLPVFFFSCLGFGLVFWGVTKVWSLIK